MKMEISSGAWHGGTIELIDCNEPFRHAYWLQVLDREGNKTLPDKVLIGKAVSYTHLTLPTILLV